MSREARIEYVPLEELRPWARNPKAHDEAAIAESIRAFGFTQPIILDEATSRIVSGHGRLAVLLGMATRAERAPKRVQVGEDGAWLVPVVRGISFSDPTEAEAYLLTDNLLVELGGWDLSVLDEMLGSLRASDLNEALGFEADIASLHAALAPPEDAPLPPEARGGSGGGAEPEPEGGTFSQLVLLYTPENYDRLIAAVTTLRERFGTTGVVATVYEAVSRAYTRLS